MTRPWANRCAWAIPNLLPEVERDHCVYGEECKFGEGKTLCDGMGRAGGIGQANALDLLITNELGRDYTGVYKADVGIKGERIIGIGKAGNPHIISGVDPRLVVGVTTEVVAGEGHILTAGGIDCHIHFNLSAADNRGAGLGRDYDGGPLVLRPPPARRARSAPEQPLAA